MSLAEDLLLFLAEQPHEEVHWGKPLSASIIIHAVVLFFILTFWQMRSLKPVEAVHVLEIHVMGREDLAMKGTVKDFTHGPLPEETPMAEPLQSKGPLVHGNTSKLSRSVARTKAAHPTMPPPRLTAAGPLFGSGSSVAAEAGGIGREKIYAAASVASQMAASSRKTEPSDADGLVGQTGGPANLNARRGSGRGGKPSGNFLTGGSGSVDGGLALERRGEPIVDHVVGVSDDPVTRGERIKQPVEPLPDDAFFSIRGPLSHRKIIKPMKVPRYPRWAEEQGVEAQVSVRLTVAPNGRVMTNLHIEQTSGFSQLDQLSMDALSTIRFVPLTGEDSFREEWGIATFNFRLKKIAKTGG